MLCYTFFIFFFLISQCNKNPFYQKELLELFTWPLSVTGISVQF